jgi:uncharacterized protein (DUF433 family)
MSRPTRAELLQRITYNPDILGGKPTIRGRRLAVEHVLGMLAAGDSPETLMEGYEWLEREDILACLAYAYRAVVGERFMPRYVEASA